MKKGTKTEVEKELSEVRMAKAILADRLTESERRAARLLDMLERLIEALPINK